MSVVGDRHDYGYRDTQSNNGLFEYEEEEEEEEEEEGEKKEVMDLRIEVLECGKDEEMLTILNAFIDEIQKVSIKRKLNQLAFDATLVPTDIKIAFVDPSEGCKQVFLCTQMVPPEKFR